MSVNTKGTETGKLPSAANVIKPVLTGDNRGFYFIFKNIFCILLTLKYNEYRNYNSPIRVVVSSNAPPSTIRCNGSRPYRGFLVRRMRWHQ